MENSINKNDGTVGKLTYENKLNCKTSNERDEKAWEWVNENELSYRIWDKKYRFNNESFDDWLERVSGKNQYILNLIKQGKFCFGGRILSNRGLNKGSMANCTTLGRIDDSISGIMEAARKLALSFQAEQGQGLSLTNIRPKGALIKNRYPSEGVIPFMEIFNTVTQSIQQGGVRRGALLMSISIWHKDAEDFIKVKSDFNRINNANLSLEIDDEFLKYVKNDYKTGQETIVHLKKKYGDSIIEYDVCPIKLYKMICEHAYKYAEPCILYTNRLFNYNLMEYVEEYEIQCTNACSEEPLLANALCVLSSFNLSEYIINPYTPLAEFDYLSFKKDIPYVVKAMDDVVEENIYKNPLIEQIEVAKRWRNFGIGIMGLSDALVKLGIKYGSDRAVNFSSVIMKILFRYSIFADIELADERGAFPGFKPEIWDSKIISFNFSKEEINNFKSQNKKLRNCSLLSVAPTGSIGTMIKGGVSTGTEPFFALEYNRTTKTLDGKDSIYKCKIQALKDYQKINNTNDIPNYFVTAQNINWKERIDMQAALQNSNDTAISSTCNLRDTSTVKDVEELYLYAWEKGCKGMSIYVENSRPPILETKNNKKENHFKEENKDDLKLTRGQIIKAGNDCIGLKRDLITGCGTLHCTAYFDPNTKELRETYLSKGSKGGCQNFMIGLSRMISLAARGGISIDKIIDQLNSCGTCPSYAVRSATKKDTSKGSCCPIAVGNALKEMYEDFNHGMKKSVDNNETYNYNPSDLNDSYNYSECPMCHNKALTHQSGCVECHSCGYTKCD